MREAFCLAIGLGILTAHALAVDKPRLPDAKVTLKVTGEDEMPVSGANASVGFSVWGTEGRKTDDISIKGITNDLGEFTVTHESAEAVGYIAMKAGYYESVGTPFDLESIDNARRRWLPWNPLLPLVLKKIGAPAPMYVKGGRKTFPKINEPIGFDLAVGDWVEPDGKGKTADFNFHVKKWYKDDDNYYYELTVFFSNPDDGIQEVYFPNNYGSVLKFPRQAPLEGYRPAFTQWAKKDNGEYQQVEPQKAPHYESSREINHFFRVRSKRLPDGSIVGLYGKIRGTFRDGDIKNEEPPSVAFHYYLNPDTTRNMEFDPKMNLFDLQLPPPRDAREARARARKLFPP